MISSKKAIGGSIAAILVLLVSQVVARLLASVLVIIKIPTGICNIVAGVLYFVFIYFLLKVLMSKILKLNMADYGFAKIGLKFKWCLIAIVLPLIVTGVYLLFFQGKFVPSDMNGNQIFTTLSAGIVFMGIAAGFVEEMVFRGVILNLLKERWNIWIAVIVPSVLFGLVHVIGMDFSLGSCLLVILAGTMVGIMFSLIEIESGSVWNNGLVHAIWNIVIIGGGLSIGEEADSYSVMSYVLDSKAFAITGGEFGIESSVIALIAYIVVAVFAFAMIMKKQKD